MPRKPKKTDPARVQDRGPVPEGFLRTSAGSIARSDCKCHCPQGLPPARVCAGFGAAGLGRSGFARTLYDGLTKDEMLAGKSKLRNPVLADVFHKMGIIEKWGTGLPRIFARCAKAGVPEPRIAVGGSTVSIMFPRPGSPAQETEPATQETAKPTLESRSPTQETTQETKFTPQETGLSAAEKILESLKHNPTLTLAELARQLGMTRDGVKYHVELLKKNVGLRHEGPTKKGRWVLPNAQTDIT